MNLCFKQTFLSTLLAGSAMGRLSTEWGLGNDSYTGTYVLSNTIGNNLGRNLLILNCADGTCEGRANFNLPGSFNPFGELDGRLLIPHIAISGVLDIGDDGRGGLLMTFFVPGLGPNGLPSPWRISPREIEGGTVTSWTGSPELSQPGLGMTQSLIDTVQREQRDGYDNSSVEGVYGWFSTAGDNIGVYYGEAAFDGNGGFEGILTSDVPCEGVCRDLSEGEIEGTYAVDTDGFVTMSQTGPGAPAETLTFVIRTSKSGHARTLKGSWDSVPEIPDINEAAVTAVDLSFLGELSSPEVYETEYF